MPGSDVGRATPLTAGLPCRGWLLVLLAAGLLQVTLVTIYYWPQPKLLVGDELSYLASTAAIRAGAPDPDPLRAPLYARLLIALGISPTNRLPIQLLQLVVYLGVACTMRGLARRLVRSPLAGDVAAALTLLYPTLAAYPLYLWPEILHIGLWVGAFFILASGRRHPAWLAAAGLLVAIALLTRHLLLGFLPLVVLALWLDERRRPATAGRRALLSVASFVTPVVLVAAPFLVLDHLEDGRLRAGSNVRFNLWVGLNDPSPWSPDRPIVFAAYRHYVDSTESAVERDRRLEERITAHLSETGWLETLRRQLGKQYFRLFDRESYLTAQLPGGRMHGERRGYRQVPPLVTVFLRGLDLLVYALLLAGAAWGLCRIRFGDSIWLSLAVAFLLYNLLLFLGLHAKSRYLLQLVPFMILFASGGIAGWLTGPPLGGRRRLVAAGLTLLLLFLALGPDWLT